MVPQSGTHCRRIQVNGISMSARWAQNTPQADFRCLADGFLAAAVSFACFLPAIGISISFWPMAFAKVAGT
jgi:hypothetical protein